MSFATLQQGTKHDLKRKGESAAASAPTGKRFVECVDEMYMDEMKINQSSGHCYLMKNVKKLNKPCINMYVFFVIFFFLFRFPCSKLKAQPQ